MALSWPSELGASRLPSMSFDVPTPRITAILNDPYAGGTHLPDLTIVTKTALGYAVTRQSGSHLRVTTQQGGEHHEVVLKHSPIKLGTLKGILRSVAQHHRLTVAELLETLDL